MPSFQSNQDAAVYSVPRETRNVLHKEILQNHLHKDLPQEILDAVAHIKFIGSHDPSIPINWRLAESIASLKGFEGAMLGVLLKRKYGVDYPDMVIDTDQAQLFFMSAFITILDPDGKAIETSFKLTTDAEKAKEFDKLFPSWDVNKTHRDTYRSCATNIYETKDKRWFHLHASLNADLTLDSIGFPRWRPDLQGRSREEILELYMDRMKEIESQDMEHRVSEIYGQAGTTCWSTEEYLASEHGRANSKVGLYEIHEHINPTQVPCWWPPSPDTSAKRPLAGLKVVDLTRVIAGPAITRSLAEMGASVMRVVAPHVADLSVVHPDLNWGKWNCFLDLGKEGDREKLRGLISDADVVVSGYRPGVLDKWGFSHDDILNITKGRKRGLIYARENCYGWYGPWSHRIGWQQISDANCGVSLGFGRAMGLDEAVTPVFPNSDYCTGVCGSVGILDALMRRAEHGGSYTVETALNYYSQWLVKSVGDYPKSVWENVWSVNGRKVFRHFQTMSNLIPAYVDMLKTNSADRVFRADNFHCLHSKHLGVDIRCPKPVLQFPAKDVDLRYNVGTRTNGVDQPKWPDDFSVETVA
ncbi:CoA-transferase family III [Aspergillus sergii]|uniref:CoA-transferase family III n=1 Tax=Aspergillus sergii TaxID=1034303 RepID=A0A5N6XJJ5_9EURO|nr:CoA-transferase family III [Aspergillus sergii]